jgi:hypothetical protein
MCGAANSYLYAGRCRRVAQRGVIVDRPELHRDRAVQLRHNGREALGLCGDQPSAQGRIKPLCYAIITIIYQLITDDI